MYVTECETGHVGRHVRMAPQAGLRTPRFMKAWCWSGTDGIPPTLRGPPGPRPRERDGPVVPDGWAAGAAQVEKTREKTSSHQIINGAL